MLKKSFSVRQETSLTATLIDWLVDAFNREKIVYSHWKSNIDLAHALAGRIDLDLFIDRKSLSKALTTLTHLGFKRAVTRWGANPPGIHHYYGLDPDTKQLIHVHLFSRVLTGESYVKSHLFPFEEMLLENVYYSDQIRVTSKSAELVLFTLRMFIKYGSFLDLVSLRRKSENVKAETLWLQDNGDLSDALSLLKKYCPVIEEELFVKCVETLNSDTSLIRRMILARHVRRRLKVYAKYTFFRRYLAYMQLLWTEVFRRLGKKKKNKVLQNGGTVIAFAGADATGKSTLVAETGCWLGDTFAVKIIHTGKPPSAWLTAPVNIVLQLVRGVISLQRTGRLKNQTSSFDSNPSKHKLEGLSCLPHALRAITLAWDRQRLILKARRLAAKGEIIICDRYPSRIIGAMDSPRLEEEPHETGIVASIYNRLARFEKRLYRQIPPTDTVLKLKVSLETAKKRNQDRNKKDGDAYLEARHRQYRQWFMPGTNHVYDIDTEQNLEETLCDVKKAIWESL
jgi:thymidylate kinase